MNVWNRPSNVNAIATPSVHSTEGFPQYDGWTTNLVYSVEGNTRFQSHVSGVNYYDGSNLASSPNEVEDGLFDNVRALMFSAHNKLRRFLWLTIGPKGWESTYAVQGDNDAGCYPNFAKVWQIAAAGSGTSINVRWQTGDSTELRNLDLSPTDANVETSLQPCMGLIDTRSGAYGMCEIVDVEYLGETKDQDGTYHYATITTDNSVDADRSGEGRVWFFREHFLDAYPSFPLGLTWAQRTSAVLPCKHSVKTHHNAFSSFANSYPSANMAAGISNSYFCAKMNEDDVRLDLFSANCTAAVCPHYEAWEEYIPCENDFHRFFLGRGKYLRQLVIGSLDLSNWRIGVEDWAGVLQLLGLPIGYDAFSEYLYKTEKLYYGQGGLLEYRTGNTTSLGVDEFQDWDDWIAANNNDSFPLLTGIEETPLYDFCGNTAYSTRTLNSSTNPGSTFSKAIGARRLGFDDAAETYTLSGVGDAAVQRVRPKRYTSTNFTKPISSNSETTGETHLLTFDTHQDLGGDSTFKYDCLWTIPRFGEETNNPVSNDDASISATIYDASVSGNVLTLVFELGTRTLTKRVDATTTADATYYMGGTVCASEVAHEITNPKGVAKIGDRQWGLVPGRSITFGTASLEGAKLTCLESSAFADEEDTSKALIDVESTTPGVPQWVRDNQRKRDSAKFALEGRSGELVRKLLWDDGGALTGETVSGIEFSSIAPSTLDSDGNATGYQANLSFVYSGNGEPSALNSADYVWEPSHGRFFINSNNIPTGTFNFFSQGYVFDTRRTHPAEMALVMDRAVDGLLDGWVEVGTFSWPASDTTIYSYLRDDDMYWTPYGINMTDASYDFVSEDTGDEYEFDLNGGVGTVNKTQEDTTISWSAGATTVIGASGGDIHYEGVTGTVVKCDIGAMLLDLGAFRFRAEDIAEAKVDVAIDDLEYFEYEDKMIDSEILISSSYPPGDGDTFDYGLVTNTAPLSKIGIGFGVLHYSGDTITSVDTSSVSTGSMVAKSHGGNDYAVGTLDCTQALKDLIGFITASTDTITVVAYVSPTAGISSLSARNILDTYTSTWSYAHATETGAITDAHTKASKLQSGRCDFDNLRVKFNASALTRGATYHFDGSTQANAPNLLA